MIGVLIAFFVLCLLVMVAQELGPVGCLVMSGVLALAVIVIVKLAS